MNNKTKKERPSINKNGPSSGNQVARNGNPQRRKINLRPKASVRAIVRENDCSNNPKDVKYNFQVVPENLRPSVAEKFKNLTGEQIGFLEVNPKTPSQPSTKNGSAVQESVLNEPRFLTSNNVIKNLEKLKSIEFQTQKLVKSKKIDLTKCKGPNKVSSVLNTNPCDVIFSRLQPILFNVEQFTDASTEKLCLLAEKYAPPKVAKDPTISLQDFLTSIVISKAPVLPESSFLTQCHQFQINPFSDRSIKRKTIFDSYMLFSA